jgi:hypothetical protein
VPLDEGAEQVDAVGAGQFSLDFAADAGLVPAVDEEGAGVERCLGSLGELDGAGNAGAFDDCAEDVTGFGHELIGQFGVRCGSGDGFGHSVRELDLADQARVVVRAAD